MSKKICSCGREFEVQDWKVGIEREKCTTCCNVIGQMRLSMQGTVQLLKEIQKELCQPCQDRIQIHIDNLDERIIAANDLLKERDAEVAKFK